jgi:hypothetical protein
LTLLAKPKQLYRAVLGNDSALERKVSGLRMQRRQRRKERDEARVDAHVVVERGESWTSALRQHSLVVRPDEPQGDPVGIRLYGGCDLPAAFEAGGILAPRLRSVLAISECPVDLTTSQAVFALQTLEDIPEEVVAETCEVLRLDPVVFRPIAFEPTITIDGEHGGEFAPTLVVLSLGAEAIRSVYRHREHGFLVDPGGMWIDGQIAEAMSSAERRKWFARNFEKVGRIEVDDFPDLYRRLIGEIRARTGAEVAVFNTLTVEPGESEHNYQLRRLPEAARRRAFHVALAELSAELDIAVLDVDRALKRAGIRRQLDFAHFPSELYPVVAADFAELLLDRGIVARRHA